jgi:hypothetical protein
MRTFRTLCGVILLLIPVVGCETTQPEQVESQVVDLLFSATGVPKFAGGQGLRTFATWVMFEDADGDPSTDDPVNGQYYLWCEWPNPRLPEFAPMSVPWTYTLQISVLRAGQTEPEVITSVDALHGGEDINLTAYDTTVVTSAQFIQHKDPITEDGRLFRFVDDQSMRRQLSQGNREVASAVLNPLTELRPDLYWLGSGLCTDVIPPEAGPTVVDGQPDAYQLTLQKGDTLIVEARRGVDAPVYLETNGTEPGLQVDVFLDGRSVTSVNGGRFSAASPGAPLKFSLTPR